MNHKSFKKTTPTYYGSYYHKPIYNHQSQIKPQLKPHTQPHTQPYNQKTFPRIKDSGTPWTYAPNEMFLEHKIIKTTTYPDGTVMAICENKILITIDTNKLTTVSYPDGSTITSGFSDESTIINNPTGVITKRYPNGILRINNPNDDTIVIFCPDNKINDIDITPETLSGLTVAKNTITGTITAKSSNEILMTIQENNMVVITSNDITISYYPNKIVEIRSISNITTYYSDGMVQIQDNGYITTYYSDKSNIPMFPYIMVSLFKDIFAKY
jgi:hypothetical protein